MRVEGWRREDSRVNLLAQGGRREMRRVEGWGAFSSTITLTLTLTMKPKAES